MCRIWLGKNRCLYVSGLVMLTLIKWLNHASLCSTVNLRLVENRVWEKTLGKCAKCQRRSEIWAWLNVTFKPICFLWCRLINQININEKCVVPICKPWAEIPYCPSKISLYDSNIELLHLKHILTWKVSVLCLFCLNINE